MPATMQAESTDAALDPVVEDWSGWMISGRVRSQRGDVPYETAVRTPAEAPPLAGGTNPFSNSMARPDLPGGPFVFHHQLQ